MTDTDQIKPCPFCGSQGRIESTDGVLVWVECADEECGGSTRGAFDRAAAIEKWNHREEQSGLPAIRKQDAAEGKLESVFDDIRDELARAIAKHPGRPADPIHCAAIVAEEAGELVRAALQLTYEFDRSRAMTQALAIREEAIQTAVTAIRLLLQFPNFEPRRTCN